MSSQKWPKEIIVYTDGASRGNPGPASIGVYITDLNDEPVLEFGEKLGVQTNNFAEYSAVKKALEMAQEQAVERITLRSDSQLLIRQMNGEYKVKSEVIRPLFMDCKSLASSFKELELEHVRREFNKKADELANQALDGLL